MAATKTKKKASSTKKPAAKKAPPAEKAPSAQKAAPVVESGMVKLSMRGKTTTESECRTIPRKSLRIVTGFNPRSNLKDVTTLATSIKSEGLIHQPVVRPTKGQAGSYDLVCGERRMKALDSLGWKEVPVVVRTDLMGDDARALAVCVAENSEDGRCNLNAIEVGRVVKALAKKGWSVQRVASECGLHAQKVRRCLKLMQAPDDVQKQVASGEMSMIAGLEVAKLDEKTREKIRKEINSATSAAKVRQIAKKAAQDGTSAQTGRANEKKGAKRDASVTAWKGSRDKQEAIRYLAHSLHNCAKEDIGTVGYHEIRGALAFALWDRGDLDDYELLEPADCESPKDVPAAKKALATFAAIVQAESAKHKPDEDDDE